jgi:hypothetical protein
MRKSKGGGRGIMPLIDRRKFSAGVEKAIRICEQSNERFRAWRARGACA